MPATTVPVTIIGAFAAMAVMGFSINLLTLFAVVLAIGIVVDDAIVVVEGVSQHVERGQSPKQASIDAMRELFGPIIGITLVLMSVFLPPAFMPGITGQMYRQFALGHRRDGFDQRDQCRDLEADAMCALVARDRSEPSQEYFLSRV